MRAFINIYLIHSTCLTPVSKITGGIGTLCFRLKSFPYTMYKDATCKDHVRAVYLI